MADLRPCLREGLSQFRERDRQQVRRKFQWHAHAQRADARRGLVRDCGERPVVLGQQRPALAEQNHPGICHRHPCAVPDQKPDAKLAFQRQNRLRQGGLANVQPASGPGQASLLGDRGECPHLAYLHRLIAPHRGNAGGAGDGSAHAAGHTAIRPPSTGSRAPCTKLASSLARYAMAEAISSGRPTRPAGAAAASCSTSAAIPAVPSVRVGPGLTALTRTPDGPYSAAHDLVSSTSAALLDPYRAICAIPNSATIVETLTIAPCPRSAIFGASSDTRKNGTLTLRLKTLSKSSPVASWVGPKG